MELFGGLCGAVPAGSEQPATRARNTTAVIRGGVFITGILPQP